jgi:hypothetical protein
VVTASAAGAAAAATPAASAAAAATPAASATGRQRQRRRRPADRLDAGLGHHPQHRQNWCLIIKRCHQHMLQLVLARHTCAPQTLHDWDAIDVKEELKNGLSQYGYGGWTLSEGPGISRKCLGALTPAAPERAQGNGLGLKSVPTLWTLRELPNKGNLQFGGSFFGELS